MARVLLQKRILSLFTATMLAALCACGGIDVKPDSIAEFEGTGYTRYAWRSAPPSNAAFARDLSVRKSASIRSGVNEELAGLGYQLVDKDDAQFVIEYLAATGFNDGQLAHGGSNEGLYGSSVNREIDGASADNAQELSGSVQTGEIQIVFIDAASGNVLWRVGITMVVEDANRIDKDQVRRAVRRGLESVPPA
ncbi:MAG: DUF4136 domain-containing protein [Pseudomonadota bacterium]